MFFCLNNYYSYPIKLYKQILVRYYRKFILAECRLFNRRGGVALRLRRTAALL